MAKKITNRNAKQNKSWFWLLLSLFGVTTLIKRFNLNK